MTKPFAERSSSVQGPAADTLPVSRKGGPSLPEVVTRHHGETGGTVEQPDFTILPFDSRSVATTGSTASGIRALVL